MIIKKGTYIGIKDCNGKKLHVGDIVRKLWGFGSAIYADPEAFYRYKFHRIVYDKEELSFRLHDCYNAIEGKKLEKYPKLPKGIKLGEDVSKVNIPIYKYKLTPEAQKREDEFRAMLKNLKT